MIGGRSLCKKFHLHRFASHLTDLLDLPSACYHALDYESGRDGSNTASAKLVMDIDLFLLSLKRDRLTICNPSDAIEKSTFGSIG